MLEIALSVLIVIAFAVFVFTSRSPVLATSSDTPTQIKIPEDSVLKRHFLATLRANIESEFAPKPTDSTLKRHYDSFVRTEMDARLNNS